MDRVVWMRATEDELTGIFERTGEVLQVKIAAALEKAELELTEDPFAESESREGDDRIAFFPPLVLEFFVVPDARIVSIFHARLYGPGE